MEKDSEFEQLKMKGHRYSILALDSSNSSSFTFWSSQFASSSRSNWTDIWPVTQMAIELVNNHLISVQQKYKCYILFHVKNTANKFWNDAEYLLKFLWTSHLQICNEYQKVLLLTRLQTLHELSMFWNCSSVLTQKCIEGLIYNYFCFDQPIGKWLGCLTVNWVAASNLQITAHFLQICHLCFGFLTTI